MSLRRGDEVCGPQSPDELRARHTECLSGFVIRARRAEQHSLAADLVALEAFTHPTFTVMFTEGEDEAVISQQVPPEEQLESAAVRIRPFLLEGEPLHWRKVLEAVGYLVRDPAVKPHLKTLKEGWATFRPRGTELETYAVQLGGSDLVADNRLAFSWLYGDVVHADEDRLAGVAPHSVQERYRAAVPLVCRLLVMTLNTLGLVRALVQAGALELEADAFTRPVVVDGTDLRGRTASCWASALDASLSWR